MIQQTQAQHLCEGYSGKSFTKAIVATLHKNSQTYLLAFTDAQNVLNCHQGMNIFLNLASKSDVSPSLISICP